MIIRFKIIRLLYAVCYLPAVCLNALCNSETDMVDYKDSTFRIMLKNRMLETAFQKLSFCIVKG